MIIQSEKKLKLDVVTVENGAAQLITEGLTEEEQSDEELRRESRWLSSGYEKKSQREANFPLPLLELGTSYLLCGSLINFCRISDQRYNCHFLL